MKSLLPSSLKERIRQEAFSAKWRDAVRALYSGNKIVSCHDETAVQMEKFLQEKSALIQHIVDTAEELGTQAHPNPFVLCHADIHGGNVLIDEAGALYLVDFDNPLWAPKERDLMFIGGGVGNVWNKPQEVELFYQGYGETNIDWTILAYYRFERIVEDIAVYAEELLFTRAEGHNRSQIYQQFISMFEPNGVIDMAYDARATFSSESPRL